MKLNEMYPSLYLKSEDIEGSMPVVTIEKIEMENMVDGALKPVMYFAGKEKAMVLNKTNANTIAYHYGQDTNQWTGKKIQLRVEPVQGPNGMTKGLRVGVPHGSVPQAAQQAVASTGATPTDTFDDDIPF